MAAATTPQLVFRNRDCGSARPVAEPEHVTLLELVQAVSASAKDDREVVATILSMLCTGRVQLRGNLRDEPIESLED